MRKLFTWRQRVVTPLLVGLIVASSSVATPQAQKKQRDVVVKARDSYYSVKRLGLVGFRANVQPNWEKMLELPPQSSGMKVLNGLRFSIVFGPDGSVIVNHEAEVPPPNDEVARRYNEIYAGIDKVMKGFFDTWNLFMFGSPFPEPDSAYDLQDLGGTYRLNYAESNDRVTTTFNKDFSINEIQVAGSGYNGTVKPEFSKTRRGYILVGYQGIYVSASEKTDLRNEIEYGEVDGFQLPVKLNVEGAYNGGPVNMELAFSKYQISQNK